MKRREFIIGLGATALAHPAKAALFPYTRRYTWIPRAVGADPLRGEYRHFPAGGYNFISDMGANLPSGWSPIPPFPSWFPQKVLITKVGLYAASTQPFLVMQPNGMVSGFGNQIMAWIDKGGQYFASANGAEAGADFAPIDALHRRFWSGDMVQETVSLDPPQLLDRDAGDKLSFGLYTSQYHDWCSLEIGVELTGGTP